MGKEIEGMEVVSVEGGSHKMNDYLLDNGNLERIIDEFMEKVEGVD